jgi:hypothetical protein
MNFELNPLQRAVIERLPQGTVFLQGMAGSGKSTTAAERVLALIGQGVSASEILIMVPQRTLASPYLQALEASPSVGGTVRVATLAGLARQAIQVFYPLAAQRAGFRDPLAAPTFLSLEAAQYFMARLLTPIINAEGLFASVTIDRNRLYSQILDNLNKAAVVGFPVNEIGARLRDAAQGDEEQRRVFDDVQRCALIFREYCLENGLLDYSLQIEVFVRQLWPVKPVREYLTRQYRHLIYDNIEEDVPAAHDLVRDWLKTCESALLVYDTDAGFRRFLGADPVSAADLAAAADEIVTFESSLVTSAPLRAFGEALAVSVGKLPEVTEPADPREALAYDDSRYFPQMIDGVVSRIASLVHDEGVLPSEIVIIAPFVSDALQFMLINRLSEAGIRARAHRPSRALRQEQASRALLTFAKLAHPRWRQFPADVDVTHALVQAVDSLDLVRAQLLVNHVYTRKSGALEPFSSVPASVQERISYLLGDRYETLRAWLAAVNQIEEPAEETPLDHFWSRLFGEVLSQSGFGFHDDVSAAEVTANMIDSARRFRQTIPSAGEGKTFAQEYVELVEQGVFADQYLRSWELADPDTVLIAPAYTFLMRNVPVDYQFWISVGAPGWSQRLYQPLTHPYVLSREWLPGRPWTDADEVAAGQDVLYRLTFGLVRRCRRGIYLGFSELGEQGREQRGLLLMSIQQMLRRLHQEQGEEPHV